MIPYTLPMAGMRVISTALAIQRKQWRTPRSKKRRIRRKWAKDPRNFRDMPAAYHFNGAIVCHPKLIETLKRKAHPCPDS